MKLGSAVSEVRYIILPLVLLAVFSVWIFHHWNPLAHQSILFKSLGIMGPDTEGGDLIPFLSIVLVVAGSVLAYSFFKPGTAYSDNFDKMRAPISKGGIFVFEGFGLAWLYHQIGRWTVAFSKVLLWVDQRVIDLAVHLAAISSVVLSKVLALTDRFGVDGPVNWTAGLARFLGRRLAGLSSKDGQTQLAWLLVLVILILLWFILF